MVPDLCGNIFWVPIGYRTKRNSVHKLKFARTLPEMKVEFMIRLFGEFVKKVEYQALDSDIQKEKLDIRSACRGNPLTPYEMHLDKMRSRKATEVV